MTHSIEKQVVCSLRESQGLTLITSAKSIALRGPISTCPLSPPSSITSLSSFLLPPLPFPFAFEEKQDYTTTNEAVHGGCLSPQRLLTQRGAQYSKTTAPPRLEQSRLCHLLAVWPWAGDLASLSLVSAPDTADVLSWRERVCDGAWNPGLGRRSAVHTVL